MSTLEKIDKLDRRYIFLGLLVLSFLPVLMPMGLPVPIGPATTGSYEALDALNPGDIICMTFDYAGGSAAELYPQNVVILKHALKKDLRVVVVAFSVGGPEMGEMALEESGYKTAKAKGVDYVNLGFISGFETAMSSYAKDVHAIVSTDFFGTPLSQIPLMNEVRDIESFKYLAFTTSTSQDHYIRQFTGKSTKIVGCIQSLYFSVMQVYMGTGQLVGFLNGLRGSAEYEILTNELGVGAITMDQASITHLYGVGLLIIGNIAFFLKGRKSGGS